MRRRDLAAGMFVPAFTSHEGRAHAAPDGPARQSQRRAQVFALHREHVGPLFNDAGRWIGRSTAPARRECLWAAMSLLADPASRAKGNAVVRHMLTAKREPDHFVNSAAAQMLATNHAELDTGTRHELEDLVYTAMKENGTRAIRFMGYNDNFPAMDTLYAVLGGQLLDFAPARRRGREGLERVRELLLRRGLLSEYTSPTYSPVSLLCYAGIAELAGDKTDRELAASVEQRIWLDIATHFHAPTNLLAGPHSRAYAVDGAGHYHQVQMVLYHVYGDRIWMSPLTHMFPPAEKQVIHHDGDVPFMQTSNVWMASVTYHPSAPIARILFEKQFPYSVYATSEGGGARVPLVERGPDGALRRTRDAFEYPSTEVVTTTWMNEDFALGSSTAQFHNGYQTDAFFVNFRRAAPARSLRDISTIYSRYTTNANGPGELWVNPENTSGEASRNLFADEGRVRTTQKNDTVLVAYQAKGQIQDDFSSLRLTLAMPAFFGGPRRILIGDRDVSGRLPAESAQPEIVWIEDELLLAAFRPLLLTDHGRRCAVRVSEQNGYLSIAFFNYEGPPRRFTRMQLLETLNGFVAELASRADSDVAAFRRRVLAGKLTDEVASGQRVTDYRRPGVQLGLSYSLYLDGLKYVLVDGEPQRRPRFEATGLDPALLRMDLPGRS